MSPTMLDLEVEGRVNISTLISSDSPDIRLKECNYMGLSDCSSVDSSEEKTTLNLRATELRLGLPGSQSPERDSDISPSAGTKHEEKTFFPLVSLQDGIPPIVSGNKRGFSDTVDEYSGVRSSLFKGNWIPVKSPGTQSSATKVAHEQPSKTRDTKVNCCTNSSDPAAKAQVVGWPPIRSFRKNTLATTSKNNDECKLGALFIKVSMDGAPYLRKVDLRTYSNYEELSSALEKMFGCFTIGQCGSQGAQGREISESKLQDLLHGSEYVLTYEDKDGDWMLVGDVPWEMFIDSCKKLKIMKGSDAIGLGRKR